VEEILRTSLQMGLIQYVALLFALVVHESAHAYSAHKMGDDTAKNLGRISLNPMAHIDIVGTVILPLLQIFTGFIFFGWAKPVPVNPLNFKDRKMGMFWVSLAGPLSNVLLGTVFIVIFKLLKNVIHQGSVFEPLIYIIFYSVIINFILAVFNMIPIPPLDGSGVLAGFISERSYYKYMEKVGPYGFIILLALIYFNVLDYIFRPVYTTLLRILGA
jgi:Zn-dependent protease